MSTWILTKGLYNFRGQISTRFPNRDKKSDGTIGDEAHQAEGHSGHNPEESGHAEYVDKDKLNEVRAWDMDSDLFDKFGYTAEKLVQYLVGLGRKGVYLPFRYIIFNKRIWRKSIGWVTQTYNGPSPHTEHIHFSGDFGTEASTQKADNWNGDLGISKLGLPVPPKPQGGTVARTISDDDIKAIWLYAMTDPMKPKGTKPETYDNSSAGYFIRYGMKHVSNTVAGLTKDLAEANRKLDVTLQELAEIKALLTKPTA